MLEKRSAEALVTIIEILNQKRTALDSRTVPIGANPEAYEDEKYRAVRPTLLQGIRIEPAGPKGV